MRVVNKRDGGRGIYIGRPSKWGNPFVVGKDGTRDEVVERYREYARERFSKEELLELKGNDLVCWCAPLRCHGDVLKEMVENG